MTHYLTVQSHTELQPTACSGIAASCWGYTSRYCMSRFAQQLCKWNLNQNRWLLSTGCLKSSLVNSSAFLKTTVILSEKQWHCHDTQPGRFKTTWVTLLCSLLIIKGRSHHISQRSGPPVISFSFSFQVIVFIIIYTSTPVFKGLSRCRLVDS